MDHAARLFAEDGFDGTPVNRVAEACQISKASIYHYYGGKDDILFAILDQRLCGLRNRVCQPDPTSPSAEDRFRRTLVDILLDYQGADHAHRLQATSLRRLSAERQVVLLGYQRDVVAHVSDLIAAVAPDVFDGDTAKLRATTMSVFGMLNWFYMWNPTADEEARRSYAALVARLCLTGIPGL
nr:TetR/AcrR family transcriptional regulator [Actibacterium sp. 188UL27-1]